MKKETERRVVEMLARVAFAYYIPEVMSLMSWIRDEDPKLLGKIGLANKKIAFLRKVAND